MPDYQICPDCGLAEIEEVHHHCGCTPTRAQLLEERDSMIKALTAVSEDSVHGPGLEISEHTLGLVVEVLSGIDEQWK